MEWRHPTSKGSGGGNYQDRGGPRNNRGGIRGKSRGYSGGRNPTQPREEGEIHNPRRDWDDVSGKIWHRGRSPLRGESDSDRPRERHRSAFSESSSERSTDRTPFRSQKDSKGEKRRLSWKEDIRSEGEGPELEPNPELRFPDPISPDVGGGLKESLAKATDTLTRLLKAAHHQDAVLAFTEKGIFPKTYIPLVENLTLKFMPSNPSLVTKQYLAQHAEQWLVHCFRILENHYAETIATDRTALNNIQCQDWDQAFEKACQLAQVGLDKKTIKRIVEDIRDFIPPERDRSSTPPFIPPISPTSITRGLGHKSGPSPLGHVSWESSTYTGVGSLIGSSHSSVIAQHRDTQLSTSWTPTSGIFVRASSPLRSVPKLVPDLTLIPPYRGLGPTTGPVLAHPLPPLTKGLGTLSGRGPTLDNTSATLPLPIPQGRITEGPRLATLAEFVMSRDSPVEELITPPPRILPTFTQVPDMGGEGMARKTIHNSRGNKDNWTMIPTRPYILAGDSNMKTLRPILNSKVQLDVYPGCRVEHMAAIVGRIPTSCTGVKKVLFSVGINDKDGKSDLPKALRNLYSIATTKFPNAMIWLAQVQHSPCFSEAQKERLRSFNEAITLLPWHTPKLHSEAFHTAADKIHWDAETAHAHLQLWAQHLNLPL